MATVTVEREKLVEGVLMKDMPEGSFGEICYSLHSRFVGKVVTKVGNCVYMLEEMRDGYGWTDCNENTKRVKLYPKGTVIKIVV